MLLEERKRGLEIQKWSTRSVSSNFRTEFEINPLEGDFYCPTPLPSGISCASDLPTHYKFLIPSMVGVWIFSGTTQYINFWKYVNTELFTQLARFELHKYFVFNCFGASLFVNLVNTVWQNFSKNSWK